MFADTEQFIPIGGPAGVATSMVHGNARHDGGAANAHAAEVDEFNISGSAQARTIRSSPHSRGDYFGQGGNHRLFGGPGDDDLRGDAGDDLLVEGDGGNHLVGGEGTTTA